MATPEDVIAAAFCRRAWKWIRGLLAKLPIWPACSDTGLSKRSDGSYREFRVTWRKVLGTAYVTDVRFVDEKPGEFDDPTR